MFEVHELLRVIDDAPISNYEVKGVTTRGGKTTRQDIQNDNTNMHTEEPLVVNHDKLVEPKEVLVKNQHQKTNEPVVQPSIKMSTPTQCCDMGSDGYAYPVYDMFGIVDPNMQNEV
ncbi:hypothetical protein Tco_1392829 [Tanacetum coccineum]